MTNMQIREKFKEAGVFQYEVADAMGISEPTLVRWLRKPLDEKRKKLVFEAIDAAKAKKEE